MMQELESLTKLPMIIAYFVGQSGWFSCSVLICVNL